MAFNSPGNVYQQVEINTSNNLQLVVMLYDGAVKFLTQGRNAIVGRQVIEKAQMLDRALAIIGELQNTLKVEEGGEVAVNLDRLYTYMTERVLESSSKMDPRPLDEVIKLLNILNSAWKEIARKGGEAQKSTTAAAFQPATVSPSHPAPEGSRSSLEFFG